MGIRTRNLRNQSSVALGLGPHGHRIGTERREKPSIWHFARYRKFHHPAQIYWNIKQSVSSAKCHLKPIAISWLRLKLQQMTSLPQSCCRLHPYRSCTVNLGGRVLYFGPDSLYWLKYFMVLFSPSNHMQKQCLTRCQAIPFSSIFADHLAISFYINQSTAYYNPVWRSSLTTWSPLADSCTF